MTWDAFHAKAKGALPAQELKAKRYWIGILALDKSPEQQLSEGDFLWMKGHAKITFHAICEIYREKYKGLDVNIMFKDQVPEPTAVVKDLNHYADNIVVFIAQRQAPMPLRPVGHQIETQTQRSQSPQDFVKNTDSTSALSPSVLLPPKHVAAPVTNNFEAPPLTPVSAAAEANQNTSWHPVRQPIPSRHTEGAHAPTPAEPELTRHETPTWYNPEGDPSLPTSESKFVQNIAAPVHDTSYSSVKLERRDVQPFEGSVREPLEAFNPDMVFTDDQSLEPGAEAEAKPTDVFVRKLIEKQDPELLEAGVKQALKVLDSLECSFSQHATSSPDAETWLKSIEKLKAQAERKPTVVGVVGNTGAGKSSVINALLDEERLVPTNCMRACTAVVTEMSWNDSPDPNRDYRASIEFITAADWEKEVRVLLKEFLTDTGSVSRDTSNPDSDAGIAWAKFHAVYPNKSKETLSECTVDDLMKVKPVLDVLGTTKYIDKSGSEPFYRNVQRYVDSKEKSTGKKKAKDSHSSSSEMEYWPLIKVVKIQVKSPALSTGAVIVDLPGVHDSNAARAAVAQGYMKQCTGLWIVAPINRAVDDKAAKTLLGDSFKRQLKYDGGFSSVTFICSKTDDISITEATDSLELEEQMSVLDHQEQDCKKRRQQLDQKNEDLKESKDIYQVVINEATDELEVWDDSKDRLNDGEIVYAPAKKINKRKQRRSDKNSRKRRQATEDDDEDDEDNSVSISSDDDSDSEGIAPPQKQLTEGEIKANIEELKTTRKQARRDRIQLEGDIKDIRQELAEINAKMVEIRAEMSAICIAGRNEYSKGAIQQDFAAGIRELDMENAIEEDEENFNPDMELRDYDKVAKSLPVFCVSSRAYQKLCGRLQKDEKVPGFKTPEETEMPQLQAHCKRLTESGRIQTCRTFLLGLCRLLNTFSLWSSNDSSGLKMTSHEQRKQVQYLRMRLDELEKGLEKAVLLCATEMKRELYEQIFEKYPDVVSEAAKTAPSVARGWGAHKSNGGLHFMTYKALVNRNGVYNSTSAGHRDFNAELIDPITKRLATGWERTFQNRLPKAFEAYTRASISVLHNFYTKIEERVQLNGVGLASLSLLKNSMYTYEQQFNELNATLIGKMTELQRDANRDFTPAIVSMMEEVYDRCAGEKGIGCYMRMKAYMDEHVERTRHHMFSKATQTVMTHLNQMCGALEEQMATKVDEIFMGMQRDYMQALGGVHTNQEAKLPNEERTLRSEVKSVLLTIDDQLRSVVDGVIDEHSVKEQETEREVADELGSLDEVTAINDDERGRELVFDTAPSEDESFLDNDAPPVEKPESSGSVFAARCEDEDEMDEEL